MAKRILVIEDNEDIAMVVAATLQLRRYDVVTALDGLKGLEIAFAHPPDLVILDVLLPELDGYQVLKRLKSDERTAEVPVALFSAHMSETDRREALDAGAAAVLIKPFEPRKFIEDVEALVGKDG